MRTDLHRHTQIFTGKSHFTGGIDIKKLTAGILEDRAYRTGEFVNLLRRDILTVNKGTSLNPAVMIPGNKAVNNPEHCGFPASGCAGEDDKFSFFYVQTDISQHCIRSMAAVFTTVPLTLFPAVGALSGIHPAVYDTIDVSLRIFIGINIGKRYILKFYHNQTSRV